MTEKFKDGRWSRRIDVADFVYNNITPYEGDASFLAGATERTKSLWAKCLEAIEEERANGGVRSIDAKTISTITSHAAGYIGLCMVFQFFPKHPKYTAEKTARLLCGQCR